MKTYISILITTFVISLLSCSLSDNSETNQNYNEAEASELLEATISQISWNHTSYGGRIAGTYMEYFHLGTGKILFLNVTPETFDNFWKNAYYTGSLASANALMTAAIDEDNDDFHGIALILLALEYSNITNTFGDIPMTRAIEGTSNVTPFYNTQQEVYEEIISLLNQAIELLENRATNSSISSVDLIYNGDMQKWTKLAYGLKARTLLNQRKRVTGTENEILSLINNSFQSREEQADYVFNAQRINPLFAYSIERPSSLLISEYFGNKLINEGDPRFGRFSTGLAYQEFFSADGNDDMVWVQENTILPLLSFTELLFMKAEIMHHSGANESEISDILEEALTSSMIDNKIEIVDTVQAFINEKVDLTGLNNEERLEQIMDLAHVSYYGFNFIQSWNNKRRTGYPNLPGANIFTHEYNPSGSFQQRFLYPESEYLYNADNLQEALDRQDGAFVDDHMWIFE